MFFVIEADGWKSITPPEVPYHNSPLQYPEFSCYDDYGMSLVAILVDVMANKLLHSTSRWNHVVLPKSGAADSMFESWQQLNKATGLDVEKACYSECAKFRVELQAKADAVNEEAAKALKDAKTIDAATIPERIKRDITEVVVPDGVESIGGNAFEHCSSLKSVKIPDSVKSIGNEAFYWCTSLESIDIPSSVKSIGNEAFYWCTSLTSIKIPSNVESIGDSAFSYCKSLKHIKIPSSVESIGYGAFIGCTSLESIVLPSGLDSISHHAFYCCTSLKSIEVPTSVKSIGEYAFSNCTSLKSIEVLSGVTRINNHAFEYSSSLSALVFRGKTLEQVKAMKYYPWGIKDKSIIKASA